ncbi:AMP-binding protein [Agrococcus casei]|uniref:class I adenylate-forming enzyme family protein n=1 Tax=Agrococcus casei TaxID=343512 RepID=UPI003F921304
MSKSTEGVDLVAALWAAMESEGPAISFAGKTITFRQLRTRIQTVAANLQRRGMQPGDRVLFSVRPGIDSMVLALAMVTVGATVVFADPGAGRTLFETRAKLAAARWVAAESVLFAASTPLVRPLARARGIDLPDYSRIIDEPQVVFAGPWLPGVPRGAHSLRSLEKPRGVPTPLTEQHGDTDALIIFTSGTTSVPKGVVHTRQTLGAGLADVSEGLGFRPGQRVLTDQLMIGVPALIAGAHWIMPKYGLDPGAAPEDYLPLLGDADAAFLTPASMNAVLDALGDRTLPGLELVAMGGAPVLSPLLRRIRTTMPNAAIRAIYGMTEALPVAIADGHEKLRRDPADGDWVGRIVSSVSARIAADGELLIEGPGIARGYLHELPNELVTLPSGDLACIDDGDLGPELTMLARKKDMLIRDRTNIYPALYEPVIVTLPGVAEAYIVGVPDEIGDDRVVLALVLAADAAAGTQAAVERALPGLIDHAALPDAVLRIDAVPRSGRQSKPDREALSKLVAPMLEESQR